MSTIESKRIQELRQHNNSLKTQLTDITSKNHTLSSKLETDIQKFANDSKNNLVELNDHVLKEQAEASKLHHQLTLKYEALLKQQIKLLTENKDLVAKRQADEATLQAKVEELSAGYEEKISKFDSDVKANVKKISEIQGSGLVRRLLKSDRFCEQIRKAGGNPDLILKHTEIEELVREIKEKDEEIALLEDSNNKINVEVGKMSETMDTFKKLLQNMTLEKENLLQQNMLLMEKLTKSRELLLKFLPKQAGDQEDS